MSTLFDGIDTTRSGFTRIPDQGALDELPEGSIIIAENAEYKTPARPMVKDSSYPHPWSYFITHMGDDGRLVIETTEDYQVQLPAVLIHRGDDLDADE